MTKTGVLLMAYGTPRNMEEVEPYFTDIRGGRTPAPEAIAELKERYEKVGGHTPLLEITENTASRLQDFLSNNSQESKYSVYMGMKHWHPYIKKTIEKMYSDQVEKIITLTLAPHYSKMSIEEYYERVENALTACNWTPEVTNVQSWHGSPKFMNLISSRIKNEISQFENPQEVDVMFTAHSLPSRILEWNDPYPLEMSTSSQAIANSMGLDSYHFAYQSAGGTSVPWLGPDILDKIRELAETGKKSILVVPFGFICDHLEILFDIDLEAQELAKELNIELRRIRMPNATPEFIEVLGDIVLNGTGVVKKNSSDNPNE